MIASTSEITPLQSKMLQVESISDLQAVYMQYENRWLTQQEQTMLKRFTSNARRQQWLAVRWLAKTFFLKTVQPEIVQLDVTSKELSRIEFCSETVFQRKQRPLLFVDNIASTWNCAFSHTTHYAAVMFSTDRNCQVGLDLVSLAENSLEVANRDSILFWLSDAEQFAVQNETTDVHFALKIWAIKEALYKANNQGEAFQPQQYEVSCLGENQFQWKNSKDVDCQIEVTENRQYILATTQISKKPIQL